MRRLGWSLLAGSLALLPVAAWSQEEAVPTPDDFVCALAGDCAEEAPAAEEGAARPGGPRVTATRGFALSRQTPARPPARISDTGAARPAVGRVDLRLTFASGSAELSDRDRARVESFAEALQRPQLAGSRVRIEGHTDSSGGRAVNLGLSQRRAQAVADFLVGRGIAADRLDVRGYGYDRPLPGRPASAAENRRVEAVRIS